MSNEKTIEILEQLKKQIESMNFLLNIINKKLIDMEDKKTPAENSSPAFKFGSGNK